MKGDKPGCEVQIGRVCGVSQGAGDANRLAGLGSHDSRLRRSGDNGPGGFHHQGPDAPSAHCRPGYPLSGCFPAEPDSVSPGNIRIALVAQRHNPLSDTGVMPPKIHHSANTEPTETTQTIGRRAPLTDSVQSMRPQGRMARCSVPGDTIFRNPAVLGEQKVAGRGVDHPGRIHTPIGIAADVSVGALVVLVDAEQLLE